MPKISDVFHEYGFKDDRLTLLAGPCAIESYETCAEVVEELKEITDELGINYVFKSSFDKLIVVRFHQIVDLVWKQGSRSYVKLRKIIMYPL